MQQTEIHRQVEACRAGRFERLLCKMPSGWLVAGEKQVVAGYCLLLPDPVVAHLNDFRSTGEQTLFLMDMARLGEVLKLESGAARINYEMLGNLEPALHAHLFPRYSHEPEATRTAPVWLHDWAAAPLYSQGFGRELFERLVTRLQA